MERLQLGDWEIGNAIDLTPHLPIRTESPPADECLSGDIR